MKLIKELQKKMESPMALMACGAGGGPAAGGLGTIIWAQKAIAEERNGFLSDKGGLTETGSYTNLRAHETAAGPG